MKKFIYKIYFELNYSCGGVCSVADCHSTVLAYSQEEAVEKFKKSLVVGSTPISDGYRITKIKLIELT